MKKNESFLLIDRGETKKRVNQILQNYKDLVVLVDKCIRVTSSYNFDSSEYLHTKGMKNETAQEKIIEIIDDYECFIFHIHNAIDLIDDLETRQLLIYKYFKGMSNTCIMNKVYINDERMLRRKIEDAKLQFAISFSLIRNLYTTDQYKPKNIVVKNKTNINSIFDFSDACNVN